MGIEEEKIETEQGNKVKSRNTKNKFIVNWRTGVGNFSFNRATGEEVFDKIKN